MKSKKTRTNPDLQEKTNYKSDNPEGYPKYPESEDIYGKYHKDRTINPEDPTGKRERSDIMKTGVFNEKDFDDDLTGSDLDIPGPELDDELELTGGEDEENSYYSLGGDEHSNLDEDYIDLQY